MKKNKHPFIQIKNNVRGENPIIAGTGIRVIDIAIEYQYKGYTVDQIIDYHPHLKLKQIHDALSYYYENQEDFDQKIKDEKKRADKLKQQAMNDSPKLMADYA